MSRNSEEREYSVLGLDQLILDGIEEKLRSILEAERDEVAGRRAYEHIGQRKVGQYRNGYHKPRRLTCGCGTVTIRVPRLEKSYESEIVPRYERLSPAMKKLLPQLYLHGLSTGDLQESFGWLFGEDAPLSPSTIVRLKQQWEEEYKQRKRRQLEKQYFYIKTTNSIESVFSTVKLRPHSAHRLRTRISTVCPVFQILKTSTRRLNRLRDYSSIPATIENLRSENNNLKL